MTHLTWRHLFFFALALVCLTPVISSPIALILGFLLALLGWVPAGLDLGKLTKRLLAWSIIGLGFGVELQAAIQASGENLLLIVGSIVITLGLALWLTRLLKIDTKTGHLIGSGTAICGGSAIAAVGPAIQARNEQIALAVACVFLLNSVALLVFPLLGRLLSLDEYTFGVWAAIAIHDTSSVVGAAEAYGDEALITATTVKLARALGIIPIALLSAVIFQRYSQQHESAPGTRVTVPYFIVLFVVAILTAHFIPQGEVAYDIIFTAARNLLVVCLFLVGASLTLSKIKAAGSKPLWLAVLLWIFIGTGSLAWLMFL